MICEDLENTQQQRITNYIPPSHSANEQKMSIVATERKALNKLQLELFGLLPNYAESNSRVSHVPLEDISLAGMFLKCLVIGKR